MINLYLGYIIRV